MEELKAKVTKTMWESRLGAIMQTVVAASLLWIGNTVVDMRTELGILKAKVEVITAQVPQIASLMYNVKELEFQNKELERRIERLEPKLGIQNRER
jgi:hypothetical protein